MTAPDVEVRCARCDTWVAFTRAQYENRTHEQVWCTNCSLSPAALDRPDLPTLQFADNGHHRERGRSKHKRARADDAAWKRELASLWGR